MSPRILQKWYALLLRRGRFRSQKHGRESEYGRTGQCVCLNRDVLVLLLSKSAERTRRESRDADSCCMYPVRLKEA
eukprot:Gb_30691 [translate_table: standard]